MPFNSNINWTQLVGILASILVLATGGKINIDLPTQAAIVAVIQGVVAIITWVQHTFINHPANVEKAEAMARAAVVAARKSSPILIGVLLTALILGSVSACGVVPQQQDPQTILKETEAGFALAQAAYDGICAIQNAPSFCTDPSAQANYAKAKAALLQLFNTADAAIAASGNVNTATISALLAQIESDWVTYNGLVNSVQAKSAAMKGVKYRPVPLH